MFHVNKTESATSSTPPIWKCTARIENERAGVQRARDGGGETGRREPVGWGALRATKRESETGRDETGRDAGRFPAPAEDLELEAGRDAGAAAGRGVERRGAEVRVGGREVAGRSVVGLATRGAGAEDEGRGAAERDLGRGGTTNVGTSKSSPKGSNGSRGALGRGIEGRRIRAPPANGG